MTDRVVHDSLLHSSGDKYDEYYWKDENGEFVEEVDANDHSFYYDKFGNLIEIEGEE